MNKYAFKNKLDNLFYYFPYNLIAYNKTIIESYLTKSLRIELEKNKNIKNVYKNKRCFIIGNGPSIKKQDLSHLRDEYTFVTNNFILHEHVSIINPNFYCIVDPNMYNGKFPIERLFKIDEILPETTLFFRFKSKEYVEKNNLFKGKNIHYLYNSAYLNENYFHDIRLDRCIPAAVNVVLTCIMIAAYMGFSEIYLIGCDATLFIPTPDHFYATTKEEKASRESLEEKLFYSSYMFRSYRILKEYYEKKGIRIINATEGGVLEVFQREKYENIIGV